MGEFEFGCYASGSRRTCAAAVVASHLNACDLVAVIVPEPHQECVADAVLQELRSQRGTCVHRLAGGEPRGGRGDAAAANGCRRLPVGPPDQVLRCACAAAGPGEREEREARRAVLLWHDVDIWLRTDANRFTALVDAVCSALSQRGTPPGHPPIHRAVLIGGEALMASVQQLAEQAADTVRFRYVLVR